MNKMKNILFILHLPPPVHGSSIVGQSIKNSALINDAFECRFINILASHSIQDTGRASFIKIFQFIGIWFRVIVEILKKRPDVCYLALTTTGTAFYRDVLLVGILRFFRIKRVYHLHNKGVKKCHVPNSNKRLYRFVFKNADIILLSRLLYQDIDAFVPLSRVYICPNGVVDAPAIVKKHMVRQEEPIKIFFLSNLMQSKGVCVLLEACALLKNKNINFRCYFIGAENDMTAYQLNEEIKQKGLEEHVSYLGMRHGEKKQVAIAFADIFAFPTLNDCFPLVLLEAMCNGLPVVTTFEGGIPDIVQEGVTGFLVPRKNAKALADKLEELIRNPELRLQMGTAGRLKYEKEFTMDIFEHRLKEILQQVAD